MQTVNLLTIELELRVEVSNNYHFLKKSLKKSYRFFKTRHQLFKRWITLSTQRISIQWIIGFPNTYPLDSNLSDGYRYPAFEQPGPGLKSSSDGQYWSGLWETTIDDLDLPPFQNNISAAVPGVDTSQRSQCIKIEINT